MAKKIKKKPKKKLNPEDYTQDYIGTKETNQRIKEYLDKEGKGAAGKTIVEMRKRHKLIETSPGKYNVVEINPSMAKKSGGMVIAPKSGSAHYKSKQNAKSIAKKYFKGGIN
jgi:hypothetical protein